MSKKAKLLHVAIEKIKEGERFRKEYGDLTDIKQSITKSGLICPIAVKVEGDETYTLVAGGRRLRSCTELGHTTIMARVYDRELDDLDLRIIELAENCHRKEMTWEEQTSLQREIHLLQQQKFGVPAPGPTAEGIEKPGWRVADTAEMLGVSPATISTSLAIQTAKDKYPGFNWDGCASLQEAHKLTKAIQESSIRAEMARRAEVKKGGSMQTLKNKIIDAYFIGDSLEWLKKQDAEAFDMAEVDPPYGIDLTDLKANNFCLNYHEVAGAQYLIFMEDILRETFRILKPNSFCILWFGTDPWLEYLYQVAMKVGFTGIRTPGIWVKPNGQTLNPNASLAHAYETFFVLKKGKPIMAAPGRHNVFTFAPVPAQQKVHPTQKPLELLKEILKTFTFENATIASPFLGSGVTVLAAALNSRHACGCDMEASFKGSFIKLCDQHLVEG